MPLSAAVSPSHCTLTPGQPVPSLTVSHQSGRVATRTPMFQVTSRTPWGRRGVMPLSAAHKATEVVIKHKDNQQNPQRG